MATPGEHDCLATLVELDSVHVAAVVEQRCHRVESSSYHLYCVVLFTSARSSLGGQGGGSPLHIHSVSHQSLKFATYYSLNPTTSLVSQQPI